MRGKKGTRATGNGGKGGGNASTGWLLTPPSTNMRPPILKLKSWSKDSTWSPFVKLTKTGGGGQGWSLHTIGVSGAGGMAGNFATPRICLSWWATFSSSCFRRALRKRISAAVSSARADPAWKAINAIAAKAFFLSRKFIGFTPVMQTAGVQLVWQMW
jgi:hypothetical protein